MIWKLLHCRLWCLGWRAPDTHVIANDLGLFTVWWHQDVLAFLMEAWSFKSIYREKGQNVEPFMISPVPVGQKSCSRESLEART